MTVRIDQPIVGYEVVKDKPEVQPLAPVVLQPYERPAVLYGSTYKIKPSAMDAAMYVTINDHVLPSGERRPFEIFINSKDQSHAQWLAATTRLASAIMRQPMPFEYLIEELKQICDPAGAYYLGKNDPAGRGKVNSIVAHIGKLLEAHCIATGAIKTEELAPDRKAALEEKKAEAVKRGIELQLCPKCNQKAMVVMDGCLTCTGCGDSKCG